MPKLFFLAVLACVGCEREAPVDWDLVHAIEDREHEAQVKICRELSFETQERRSCGSVLDGWTLVGPDTWRAPRASTRAAGR